MCNVSVYLRLSPSISVVSSVCLQILSPEPRGQTGTKRDKRGTKRDKRGQKGHVGTKGTWRQIPKWTDVGDKTRGDKWTEELIALFFGTSTVHLDVLFTYVLFITYPLPWVFVGTAVLYKYLVPGTRYSTYIRSVGLLTSSRN